MIEKELNQIRGKTEIFMLLLCMDNCTIIVFIQLYLNIIKNMFFILLIN